MLAGGNTIIEGTILLILGIFMYFWAINTAPLANLAQIACNIPAVSNVLSQTCSKVNINGNIISYMPDIAIMVASFGGILLVMGIIISTGKKQGGERNGSWETDTTSKVIALRNARPQMYIYIFTMIDQRKFSLLFQK
jgi:hypothetical protein